ncbi:MAG: PEP-CTERM sorting domain-containing protein [Phycisphaerae bacterium]
MKQRGWERMQCAALALTVVISAAVPIHAATITLSDVATNGYDPATMTATLDFMLDSATLPATLTFTIRNQAAPVNLDIMEILFNVPNGVTGIAVTNPQGWAVNWLEDGMWVDGFGSWDAQLMDAPGGGIKKIKAGQTKAFTIDLAGSGAISDLDFVTELSAPQNSTDMAVISGARFVKNPIDGHGAAIPEPTTLSLLAIGGLALLKPRRRRRSR